MARVAAHPDMALVHLQPQSRREAALRPVHGAVQGGFSRRRAQPRARADRQRPSRVAAEIHRQFVEQKNEREGVVETEIRTAFPLDNAQINSLVADVSRRLKRRVQPRVTLDKELIGGVRITAGDEVIDWSVRGKLEDMAAALKA